MTLTFSIPIAITAFNCFMSGCLFQLNYNSEMPLKLKLSIIGQTLLASMFLIYLLPFIYAFFGIRKIIRLRKKRRLMNGR